MADGRFFRAPNLSHRDRLSTRAAEPDCDGIADGEAEKFVTGRQDDEGVGLQNLISIAPARQRDDRMKVPFVAMHKSVVGTGLPPPGCPHLEILGG
jgi:hypothetical protein